MNIIETNFNYRWPPIPLNLDAVQYIVIHHTAWIDGTPQMIHDDVLADPAKKNWAGFPYNEMIMKDGTVYIGRGDNQGAHAEGYNKESYGIACEGDFNLQVFMLADQYISLIERVKYHKKRFPQAQIVLHRDLNKTDCPGRYFPADIKIDGTPHWAEPAFDYLINHGIKINEQNFEKPMTRGEVFTLLARALGYKEE